VKEEINTTFEKKIKMKKTFLYLFVINLISTSCSKYSDGPSLSFVSKKARLCNDWVLLTELRNEEDATDETVTVKMAIDKDGTYSIASTYDALGQLQGNYSFGNWAFGDSKDVLYFYENINNDVDDEPTRTFKIKELRNKQLKLTEEFPSVDLVLTYIYVQE
jgi:hypothetical protein